MYQRIKVMIRPRPLNTNQGKSILAIDFANNIVSVTKPQQKMSSLASKDQVVVRSFAFTKVFGQEDTQEDVYEEAAFSLVENVIAGYNGTIFAYGQTASGKTYTIMGAKQYLQSKSFNRQLPSVAKNDVNKQNQQRQYVNELKGIIPRAFAQIIAVTKSQKQKNHLIQCSFIEIYNENVHDLLADDVKSNLPLKETPAKGLVIEGLKTFLVKSVQELQRYLKIGYKNRSVRQTSMNKESSRSHCIFTIRIEEEETDEFGQAKFKVGKLNLVDLAGSERQSKTKIKEQGFKEATKINLSLSALGKVINCLSSSRQDQKVYVSYRDSKLTRILQDSLGGNTKTVMIGTVSQQCVNYEQTLSTFIYSSRAKFIQNSPVLNEDPKDVLLRQYKLQIQKLKILLMQKQLQNQDLKENTTKLSETRPLLIDRSAEEAIKDKIENLEKIMKKQGDNEEEIKYLEHIQQLKIRIKRQEEREEEMEKKQKKREEDLLSIEKNYNTLNEEVDMLRGKFSDLKNKYLLKCQQLEDYHEQYQEDRDQFQSILNNKNQEIKRLETMVQNILRQKRLEEDREDSEDKKSNSSHQKTKKIFSNFKVEPKIKINQEDINLFRSTQSQRQTVSIKKHDLERPRVVSQPKIIKNAPLESRYYESLRQKKEEKGPKRSSSTSLQPVLDRQQLEKQERRNKIKQVDSLISLKNLKKDQSHKLPFMTEVQKVNSEHKRQQESASFHPTPSNLYFDIASIKNEILRQLKGKQAK